MIELNLEKTKITNINKKMILFLGYLIGSTNRKYYESKRYPPPSFGGECKNIDQDMELQQE